MIRNLALGTRFPATLLPPSTIASIRSYLAASGDENPLHRNADLTRAAGYDGILVPGMLIMGQMAQVLENWCAGAKVLEVNCRFVEPVSVGVALNLEGRVVATSPEGDLIARLTVKSAQKYVVIAEAVIQAE